MFLTKRGNSRCTCLPAFAWQHRAKRHRVEFGTQLRATIQPRRCTAGEIARGEVGRIFRKKRAQFAQSALVDASLGERARFIPRAFHELKRMRKKRRWAIRFPKRACQSNAFISGHDVAVIVKRRRQRFCPTSSCGRKSPPEVQAHRRSDAVRPLRAAKGFPAGTKATPISDPMCTRLAAMASYTLARSTRKPPVRKAIGAGADQLRKMARPAWMMSENSSKPRPSQLSFGGSWIVRACQSGIFEVKASTD